jgi:hypothetical protein
VPLAIRVSRTSDDVNLRVDPWPFGVERVDVSVPYRRVPGTSFPDEEAFRAVFRDADVELLQVVVRPAH